MLEEVVVECQFFMKWARNMVIKLREHFGGLTEAMVRRYLTKTVELKNKPMNIKAPETISKKYSVGKDPKTIEDIMEKVLATWFEGK
mgnify:CR=1 FL=1